MSQRIRSRYDIIISGGGIVGFSLLNLLSKSPRLSKCNVLLLENVKEPSSCKQPARVISKVEGNEWNEANESVKYFSNRVSSITSKSQRLLRRVGVWPKIANYSKSVSKIHVWNYNYSNRILFEASRSDINELDHEKNIFSVVENNRLGFALLDELNVSNNRNQNIAWQCSLKNLRRDTDSGLIEVTYEDSTSGQTYSSSAPLVLGCDGYKSRVREIAGIKRVENELNKAAVVGTVRLDFIDSSLNLNDTAYQRFSPGQDTVAALLPLDEVHSSFVISAPEKYAQHLLDADEDTFTEEFNRLLSREEIPPDAALRFTHEAANSAMNSLGSILGSMSPGGMSMHESQFEECPRIVSVIGKSRAKFPLMNSIAFPDMVAGLGGHKDGYQIALLGDAAHRVHPLAGQGLNMGLQDAEELVDQMEIYSQCGERIFNEKDLTVLSDILKRYNDERRKSVVLMTAGISQMQNLFKLTPSSFLSLFNRMEPVKVSLVRIANGF